MKTWGVLGKRFRVRKNGDWQSKHAICFLACANITQLLIQECGHEPEDDDQFRLFQVEYNDRESTETLTYLPEVAVGNGGDLVDV